jgi:hypothetical protein
MTVSDPEASVGPSQMADVSARQLAFAMAVAIGVALLVLLVAVLPVEYGVDPLGTGRALGLVRNAPAAAEEVPPSVEAGMMPAPAGPSTQYGVPYRVDRVAFALGPYEFLEYKYHLAQGANMVFSWRATAPLIQDFHGAPDGKGPEAEVSVDKQTRSRASGALTAPFKGMHGWYWENPGGSPIRIELTSAGFFTTSMERRSTGTRKTHDLISADAAPAVPEIKP